MVTEVTTSYFRREILESERPVVVDFYADWCLPCRQLGPEIKALSEKWERRVGLAKLDVDRAGELAQRYEVFSIPTVLLFEEDRSKPGPPGRSRGPRSRSNSGSKAGRVGARLRIGMRVLKLEAIGRAAVGPPDHRTLGPLSGCERRRD